MCTRRATSEYTTGAASLMQGGSNGQGPAEGSPPLPGPSASSAVIRWSTTTLLCTVAPRSVLHRATIGARRWHATHRGGQPHSSAQSPQRHLGSCQPGALSGRWDLEAGNGCTFERDVIPKRGWHHRSIRASLGRCHKSSPSRKGRLSRSSGTTDDGLTRSWS